HGGDRGLCRDPYRHGVPGAEEPARHDHRPLSAEPRRNPMSGIRKSKTRKLIPGVDQQLLIRDAAKLLPDPTRRLFLRGGASLGALAFLAGCDIVDETTAETALQKISYFNDRGQGWLFNSNRLV